MMHFKQITLCRASPTSQPGYVQCRQKRQAWPRGLAPQRAEYSSSSPCKRSTVTRSLGKEPPGKGSDPTAVDRLRGWWSGLDGQQQVYAVVVGAVLLLATPQLLTFAIIPIERLLIGLLLAVEEVLAAALLGSARLVGLAGAVVLAAVGVYLFLFRRRA